jgi:hypothetical protein
MLDLGCYLCHMVEGPGDRCVAMLALSSLVVASTHWPYLGLLDNRGDARSPASNLGVPPLESLTSRWTTILYACSHQAGVRMSLQHLAAQLNTTAMKAKREVSK